MTAEIEGDFVVFLIGMRINKWWKIHKWLPVALAMPKMLKELFNDKSCGLLGLQLMGGIPPTTMQYWRSFEHLEAYARSKDKEHFPEWVKFNKNVASNGDVGIWHETYLVKAGNYECIYNNMPPRGLGRASKLVPAIGRSESAKGRMQK